MECPNTTVDVSVKRNKDFFTAVINGDFDEVKRAVEEGASLDTSCNKCYVTALKIAVDKGHDEIALWLVEKGASVTLPDSKGVNAAHLAAWKRNISLFTAFIDQAKDCIVRKVDLKYFEETKESRYLISYESGDCHRIWDGLVIIEVQHDFWCEFEFTMLDLAVRFDQPEMVKLLIRKGAYDSAVCKYGTTLLMVAARRGVTEVLTYLLDVPEVVSTINSQAHEQCGNATALTTAVICSHLEPTKLLIAHGADVTTLTKEGESVLHIAAKKGNLEILQALFDAPNTSKIIDVKDTFHYTPLMYAVKHGFLESAILLVSKGANVNVVDNNGWNLFHIASSAGRKEVLEYLFKILHLIKVECVGYEQDKHGLTALHLAAYAGHSDCFEFLLKNQSECYDLVSSQPFENLNSGSNLVHAAVVGENYSILHKLGEFAFDLSVTDDASLTPLLLAIEMDNFTFVKQLLLSGASLADRMPGSTGIFEHETALQIIINYYPQPETILEEVLNSVHYISSMDDKKPPTEALIMFEKLVRSANNQGNSVEDEIKFNHFNVVKHLLDCREYKTKEKIILHPVIESFLLLFNIRFSPIYWCLLFVHFICTVTFSIIVSPKFKLGTVSWYICVAVVIIWLFFINLQKYLLLYTSSRVKFNFQWTLNIVTTILCLASFDNGVIHCLVDPRPFALICVWFHLICRMSWWFFPGVYLNIFLIILWKITKALVTFCAVIVGFGLALQRVFPEADSFKDIFLAIARTLIMSQDLGYGDIIKERHSDMAVLVLVVFTLVVSIALANFLTGLAITDVDVLEKHGRVEWLFTRLKFLTDLETTMSSSPWCNYHVTKVIYSYLFEIKNFELYFYPTDFDDNPLPSRIVNRVFSILLERKRGY